MGIRPTLYLLYGIDNLQVKDYAITDPRFTLPDGEDDQTWWMGATPPVPEPCWLAEGEPIPEGDALNTLLRNRSIAYAIGAKDGPDDPTPTKRGDDLLCWYAEGGDNRIFGYIVGKSGYADIILYGLAACDERFQNGGYMVLPKIETRFGKSIIRYFDAFDLEQYREIAEWLCRWAGFTIDPGDFKLMLYWTWS